MGTYRVEWGCCDSVTETDAWEPSECPICAPSEAAMQKDAERYRWLRIKCGLVPSAFGIGQVAMTLAGSTDEQDAKRLDAHIDAAMQGANSSIKPSKMGSK